MRPERTRRQSAQPAISRETSHVREQLNRASFRYVPSAVTPIATNALARGCLGQIRGEGRAQFRTRIRSVLGGDSAATYTSFRRTLAACLRTMAATRDETTVLVPSFCSSDYPDAIEGVGLETARYDVVSETLEADLESVRSQSFDDVLAVVAINVLGYTSRMDELASLCEDTYLVEALGYAYGSDYEGQRLGTFGDCAILNFQQGKPIPIGGGMVVSQRPALPFSDEGRPAVDANTGLLTGYSILSRPRLYGLYERVGKQLLSAVGGSDRPSTHPESKLNVAYEPPYATLSNFQGAVGCSVLDQLPQHRRQRAETAQFYHEALSDISGLDSLDPVDGLENHQYVRYPVVAESTTLRETLADRLDAAGIQASILYDWPPIDNAVSPGGSTLQDRLLTLPTHPYVTDADRERVVRILTDTATH